MATKQQIRDLRASRVQQTYSLIQKLMMLASTYIIEPCFSHNPIQQKKFNIIAQKKRHHVDVHIHNLQQMFEPNGTFFMKRQDSYEEKCPLKIKGYCKTILKNYKTSVNHFNQWSANLRNMSSDELLTKSEFEKFICQNGFPSYDITHGFETEEKVNAHIELLRNPVSAVVFSKVDGTEIDLGEEDEQFPIGYEILHSSRRTTIIATTEHDSFMNCFEYGINKATLSAPITSATMMHKSTRFTKVMNATYGQFGNYSLLLDFGVGKLDSSSCEIASRLTDRASLDRFNLMCKRKIIDLINLSDTLDCRVIFCCHAGCTYADGFIFNKNPMSIHERMRASPQCPAGHAFCLRCFEPEHAGFCAGAEAEQQALLQLPHQKLCPTCKTVIFKDGGCNHMTCGRCGQHFCWLCHRKFSPSEQYVTHMGCNQFD